MPYDSSLGGGCAICVFFDKPLNGNELCSRFSRQSNAVRKCEFGASWTRRTGLSLSREADTIEVLLGEDARRTSSVILAFAIVCSRVCPLAFGIRFFYLPFWPPLASYLLC